MLCQKSSCQIRPSIQIIDDSRDGTWSRVICNPEKVSHFVLIGDCFWINVLHKSTLEYCLVKSYVVIRRKWRPGPKTSVSPAGGVTGSNPCVKKNSAVPWFVVVR